MPDNDNDDCIYHSDAGLEGCALHHWDDDRRWSYYTGTPGNCDGPGDTLDPLWVLAADCRLLLPYALAACRSRGMGGTVASLESLLRRAEAAK